jgi:PAS domain S-box-containing protein
VAALPVVQGLAGLHEWVLVADHDDRIVWISDALASHWGQARSLRGEQWLGAHVVAEFPDRLSETLARAGRVGNEPVRILNRGDTPIRATVSAAHICHGTDSHYTVAIFRMEPLDERGVQGTLGYTKAILDSAPEGVVVVDRSRFITYANPAMQALTGYKVEELVDRPLGAFISGELDQMRIAEALSEDPSATHQVDLEVRRRDDAPLLVDVSIKLLALPDGTQVGAVAYVRDVTKIQRFQRDLERKNKELEHTVHAVSHDLRSPLVAMLGFSRLLREDYGDVIDEKGIHFIRRIEEAGRTMEGLIHDLLELSRIGKTMPVKIPVDPRQVLQQIQAEMKPRFDERGLRLRIPTEAPILHCDRTHLYQVLCNLIGNALDHMGPSDAPEISVEITEDGTEHRICVRDNGAGIAPEHHERIFEIFHSLSPRVGSHGTGIGLAVVGKIAEAHGGRAWVESEPGAGAAFQVTFAAH